MISEDDVVSSKAGDIGVWCSLGVAWCERQSYEELDKFVFLRSGLVKDGALVCLDYLSRRCAYDYTD